MGQVADHLAGCGPCSTEFDAWRAMQTAFSDIGPARPPARLQERLRAALAVEREHGTHLPFAARVALTWRTSFAPLAVQTAGGMLAAVLLLASLFRLFGPGIEVQANDDGLANLIAPSYLYSEVPPTAVETGHDVPVLAVDAQRWIYAGGYTTTPLSQNGLTGCGSPAAGGAEPAEQRLQASHGVWRTGTGACDADLRRRFRTQVRRSRVFAVQMDRFARGNNGFHRLSGCVEPVRCPF